MALFPGRFPGKIRTNPQPNMDGELVRRANPAHRAQQQAPPLGDPLAGPLGFSLPEADEGPLAITRSLARMSSTGSERLEYQLPKVPTLGNV